MTNEEIFELAETYGDWDDFGRWTFRDDDQLLAFVDAVQKAEREVCAKVCDLVAREIDDTNGIATYAAKAIRARGSDLAKVGEVGVWGET
jgi:hypothetical protein